MSIDRFAEFFESGVVGFRLDEDLTPNLLKPGTDVVVQGKKALEVEVAL